jgi:hypothetical protein
MILINCNFFFLLFFFYFNLKILNDKYIRYPDKFPNELHIQLLKAKDLPIMDKAMLIGKGSSDPFVKFECFGASDKSSVKKKNLNPEWNESFVLKVDDPAAILEVIKRLHPLSL